MTKLIHAQINSFLFLSPNYSVKLPVNSHWYSAVLCSVTKSCPTLATPWTVAHQALLSMGFPRQEYWSGLPFPSPGDLPVSEIEPRSHDLAGRFFTAEPRGKPHILVYRYKVYSKWNQNMNDSMKCVDCNSHILHHFTPVVGYPFF